eukprot:gene6391-7045_t
MSGRHRHRGREGESDGEERYRSSPNSFDDRDRRESRSRRSRSRSRSSSRSRDRGRRNREGEGAGLGRSDYRRDGRSPPRDDNDRSRDGTRRYRDSRSPSPVRRERRAPQSFLDKAEEARRRAPEHFDWGTSEESPKKDSGEEEKPKEKPNFGLSGALAKDERTGNAVNGVVLKFTEPAEAALPDKKWRLYVYKGEDLVETLHIHRRSCFLLGRDTRVADVPLLHPSCSLQHAVIQYRDVKGDVKPYLMDLQSSHGTKINGKQLETARYYELRPGDLIEFATSTRQYVLLHDKAA